MAKRKCEQIVNIQFGLLQSSTTYDTILNVRTIPYILTTPFNMVVTTYGGMFHVKHSRVQFPLVTLGGFKGYPA